MDKSLNFTVSVMSNIREFEQVSKRIYFTFLKDFHSLNPLPIAGVPKWLIETFLLVLVVYPVAPQTGRCYHVLVPTDSWNSQLGGILVVRLPNLWLAFRGPEIPQMGHTIDSQPLRSQPISDLCVHHCLERPLSIHHFPKEIPKPWEH